MGYLFYFLQYLLAKNVTYYKCVIKVNINYMHKKTTFKEKL